MSDQLLLTGNLEESARKAAQWLLNRKPVKTLRDWGIAFSLWPPHFTTSCCGTEFGAFAAARFDAERFGMLPFASSRQSNILTIEGTLTRKMARAARIVYDQMPEPKYVIALGACILEGGIFWNSYNTVLPSDVGIPVDLYLPGCPTRPEAIARGLLMLQKKIRTQGAIRT
ncbi:MULTISPECIES: NADH-quinone oxidoreductase subunit B [Metallosphaera]|uniref:NADH dehydrogenase subunit B n=3 Tax=Metallosphaera TaxID=41980 RepID=A4YIA0_METS5|nr:MULTISPECIES: NADH-quinone oxidoreductase subunit NuoB [Metallosphaera]BCS91705.1 MAG: F(420)H(2) dehydrogenase subunit B [Metallosphaera javensis (ex Sakai et al. 2022)]ABP96152.1 NADH dehydrogenase subunit B [Metallosphaera sedula DSM 5348]AIM28135.1 NADH dehydrogenase subunit B [Metallosphaera sedula]AKV74959.1 NADH dehydrogenase [Metallosphaera sedula]AKV77197.1 NADH dehydrogenase [Metallosphaera sedula]